MDPIPDEPALGLQMALFQTEWVVESSVSSRFLNPLCLKESLKKMAEAVRAPARGYRQPGSGR